LTQLLHLDVKMGRASGESKTTSLYATSHGPWLDGIATGPAMSRSTDSGVMRLQYAYLSIYFIRTARSGQIGMIGHDDLQQTCEFLFLETWSSNRQLIIDE
jgi:hypothetical protein